LEETIEVEIIVDVTTDVMIEDQDKRRKKINLYVELVSTSLKNKKSPINFGDFWL